MAGLKRRAAEALDRAGLTDLLLYARARVWSPWLTVLTYHRVRDGGAPNPFDSGVVDATPDQLDAHLGLLRRYFNVIDIEDLRAFLRGRPLPPNPALVTFDDGYRECLETALPILQRHAVRAVFFIATTYVEERRVFWWDRVSYLLKRSGRPRLELSYPAPTTLALGDATPAATRAVLRVLKDHYDLDIPRFLDELSEAAGVPWNRDLEARLADELVLTWDGVRALRDAGQSIESHTRTHRVLQTLSKKDLESELAGARAELEARLDAPVDVIAYPVGKAIARIAPIREAIHAAGYEIGFSNQSGVNYLPAGIDPLDVRRVAVEADITPSHFRGMMAVPSLLES